MQTTLPTFTIDNSTSPPKESYSGVDLTKISNYTFAGLTDSVNHWTGDEAAVKFDGDYDLELGRSPTSPSASVTPTSAIS